LSNARKHSVERDMKRFASMLSLVELDQQERLVMLRLFRRVRSIKGMGYKTAVEVVFKTAMLVGKDD
jgi:hypothetical protein